MTIATAPTKTCQFCAETVRAEAVVCKHCGRDLNPAAVKALSPKKFKWWLWLPLGGIALFFTYAATIPENERQANQLRRVCEKELMPKGRATQYDCDQIYNRTLRDSSPKESCPPGAPDCSWGK